MHWGGGEALLASIGTELARLGHSVSWIVREHSEVAEQISADGSEVLFSLRSRGVHWSDWWCTRRALGRWAPDVVVLNDTHAVPLVGALVALCRKPRPIRLAYKHTIFPLRSSLKYRWLSDKLICVSEAARKTVVDGGLPPAHAAVIYGGCPPIIPDPTARQRVRSALGLEPAQLLIVSVGSLLACKGHSDLLAAMPGLLSLHPELFLAIAGEGAERASLEEQIRELGIAGRVRLLGFRSDAIHLIEAADLVVHPSHAEGLSLVLIQAQMLHKPLVATAVGGAAEVLGPPGQRTAWIAQPRDSSDLAQEIGTAIGALRADSEELRVRLAATSQRMKQEFSIGVSAQKLAELAAEMLELRS